MKETSEDPHSWASPHGPRWNDKI